MSYTCTISMSHYNAFHLCHRWNALYHTQTCSTSDVKWRISVEKLGCVPRTHPVTPGRWICVLVDGARPRGVLERLQVEGSACWDLRVGRWSIGGAGSAAGGAAGSRPAGSAAGAARGAVGDPGRRRGMGAAAPVLPAARPARGFCAGSSGGAQRHDARAKGGGGARQGETRWAHPRSPSPRRRGQPRGGGDAAVRRGSSKKFSVLNISQHADPCVCRTQGSACWEMEHH